MLAQSCASSRWEALIIVADGNPFKILPRLVDDLADARIWVYAEHIGDQYKARDGSSWTPDYHGNKCTSVCKSVACPKTSPCIYWKTWQ